MLIDGSLLHTNPLDAAEQAQQLEALGYAGGFTFEGPHDPFLPLVSAAGATNKLQLITGIAVAFARSPYTLAQLANDMQLASGGRFILGLGSQIKPHIERRFSMPWSKPASRMKELVQAIHAIWDSWYEGKKLDFNGEFYSHTLMPPLLNPGENPYGRPPVYIAGAGEKMVQVAAEVGDGLLVHPLHSRAFLQEYTLPSLQKGWDVNNKQRKDFSISCQALVAMGDTEEELAQAKSVVRNTIAFYSSTPAYRCVLDCHGWGELQPELQQLTRQNDWSAMEALISDEMLEALAVVGFRTEVADKLKEKYAGIADRLSIVAVYQQDPNYWKDIVKAL